MRIIVDRIEDNYMVVELEDGRFINISKELIPDIKEGDVIDININHEETSKRKKEITQVMNDLFE